MIRHLAAFSAGILLASVSAAHAFTGLCAPAFGRSSAARDFPLGSTGLGTGCADVTGGQLSFETGQFQVLLYPGAGASDHGTVIFYDKLQPPGSHPSAVVSAGLTQPPYSGPTSVAEPGAVASHFPPGTWFEAAYCNEGTGEAEMGGVVGSPGPQIMVSWYLPPGAHLLPGHVYAIFGIMPAKAYNPMVNSCAVCEPSGTLP
jgi:hypothetical protein